MLNSDERMKLASSKKRKKLTLGNGVTLNQLLDGWKNCNHLMTSKGRLCNVGRAPNSMFCGNHRPVTETNSLPSRVIKKAKRQGQDAIIRIPCPIDGSHTIFQHDLEHHVKICNTAARTAEMQSQPYYCEDCNTGFNTDTLPLQAVDCEKLLKKIQQLYRDDVAPFVAEPAETSINIPKDRIMQAVAGTARAFSRLRHAEQNVDIVRQMVAADLLAVSPPAGSCVSDNGHRQDTPLTYVELGAGKGMLGLAVKSASRPDSQLVLVERMGCKRKADKILRDNNQGLLFSRVRMDIRHCLLSALPYIGFRGSEENFLPSDRETVKKNKTVIIAKHLCGLATDISLRSLQTFSKKDSCDKDKQVDEKITENAHGVAIATCCHHACSWADYTGAEWLQARGISSQEFDLMKVWSSWAHTLTKKIQSAEGLPTSAPFVGKERAESIKDTKEKLVTLSEDNEEEVEEEVGVGEVDHKVDVEMATSVPRPAGISLQEMSVIGCMVKRIFDQGRVAYLKKLGMKAHQRRYCDRALSPECYMIIAVNDSACH